MGVIKIMRKKIRKYIRYSLALGAGAHFIELGTALYEEAYITAGLTAFFGSLDLLAVYVLGEDNESK